MTAVYWSLKSMPHHKKMKVPMTGMFDSCFWKNYHKLIFKRLIYLKEQHATEKSSICCFIPQIVETARPGPGWSQEVRIPSGFSYQGLTAWAIFYYLPKHISRGLDQRWSSQDSNQHSVGQPVCCASLCPSFPLQTEILYHIYSFNCGWWSTIILLNYLCG